MWFKNLAVFEFIEPIELDAEQIEERLADHRFVPCGSTVPQSMGWISPAGKEGQLIYSANGYHLMAFQVQDKIVPAGVIKEQLDEKVEEIELKESRRIKKKEKDQLKEEIYQSLLPRAFTRSNVIYGYIDTRGGWLVVNAASSKKAELFTLNLRKALGSLKIRIPELMPVGMLLTHWIKSKEYPEALAITDQCVLQDNKDAAGTIRCQRQDLFSDDIISLIDSGREVIQLGLCYRDAVSFVLNDEFMIKSVKFLEIIQDQANDIAGDDVSVQFDADFSIMSETLSEFIAYLHAVFAKKATVDNSDLSDEIQRSTSDDVDENNMPFDVEEKSESS
ncbi:MAG: recombination-associated protein RdgC [Francisellaceae bacterium]